MEKEQTNESFEEVLEERKSTNIYAKLLKVKSEIGTLTKKADNPFFKSKYLDLSDLLEAVEPVLEKHGLLLLQPISDGYVHTIIEDVDGKESDWVKSSIQLPTINDPQKLGSAITYFRRYTLQSLLALQAVDDDGNTAQKGSKVLNADRFDNALVAIESGEYTVAQLKAEWDLSTEQLEILSTFENGK